MNKYDILVAIDIGIHGGIAFFDVDESNHESHGLLSIRDMPIKKHTNKSGKEKNILDIDQLLFVLEIPTQHGEHALVVMEDVRSFGLGFSVSALMEQKGVIRGMAKTLGYDELLIEPKTWQRHFGIVCPKNIKTKESRRKWLKKESLETAKVKFPDWGHKIKHDGISDALLIGLWGMETLSPPK